MTTRVDGTSALQSPGETSSPRLVTLAILKANWNDGRSYLDNFVPFAVECLRESQQTLSVKQVQGALRRRFGMWIPEHAMQTILRRACRENLAIRSDGRYRPNTAVALGPAAARHGDFLRCHAALVEQLRAYAGGRYGRTTTASQATAALDAYVAEFGTPIVVEGSAASREFAPEVVADPDLAFIVHAFVEHLAAADPSGFQYLTTVVEGSMLSSVVWLPHLGAVKRRFQESTTAYLDTPFLLRALGHLGPELAGPANELLELLRQHGASVACFDKTVAELRGVILQVGRQLGTRAPRGDGDVLTYFSQQGWRRADVELIAAGLEAELKRLGFRVLAAPAYDCRSDINEQELEAVLAAEVRYHREQALHHDLNALTAIDRLRRGRHQPILENCRAIFVTTNTNLVRAARKYFAGDFDGFSWPPAILDTDLATLLWLKQPMKAPALPQKQIMADCYATLRPSQAVWDRWMDEVARTEAAGTYSDEHLDYIRFSPDAQRMLMDLTFGDAAAIKASTVDQVVAAAEAAIIRPVTLQLEVAQSQLADQQRLREDAESRATDAVSAREAAEKSLRLDRERRVANLERRSSRVARELGLVAFWALMAVIAVSLVMALMDYAPIPGPHLPLAVRVGAGAVTVVATLVAFAGAGWGFHGQAFRRHVEEWLHPRLLAHYLRLAGEEP